MTGRLLFDLTHTSHTRARTGVQRVVRSLHRELGERALAVTHDPFLRTWRPLEPWETANLSTDAASSARGARWPLGARWRGHLRRTLGAGAQFSPPADCAGFLTAEIFSPAVGAALPDVHPRIAVFHDAIALRYPELTPAGTVARFPAYLRELLSFDGIAAVSEDSRDALIDYWRWLGAAQPPPVVAIPLGVDAVGSAKTLVDAEETPTVLCVGTLEGRKNHLALLEAAEQLWSHGLRFSLRLVGSIQAETGRAAADRLRTLQARGRPLRHDGALPDRDVADAYAAAAFTVYPSISEGFGLPVIESLARGRPCICSARGALGEQSRHGGCWPLESVDAPSLASAIARLIESPDELARLSAAARARTFKTWAAYAAEIVAWMETLPRPDRNHS
ncbi:MAG: glycosyl transferase group 1 [Verrucomicrobia bacterium]|nr:glycosyl transferase group 1 [Verrucomicrobiota bacterium]